MTKRPSGAVLNTPSLFLLIIYYMKRVFQSHICILLTVMREKMQAELCGTQCNPWGYSTPLGSLLQPAEICLEVELDLWSDEWVARREERKLSQLRVTP